MDACLETLLEEESIKRVLLDYCRGVDRRDFDLVRSTYHPDAIDNHGPYNGDIDGLVAWMKKRHQGVKYSMHVIANIIIEFAAPDKAVVETYCITYQGLDPDSGVSPEDAGIASAKAGTKTQVRCRYIDVFEKRYGSWKIADRTVAYDSIQLEPSDDSSLDPSLAASTRGEDDPLWTARSAVGI
ncbi:nuclear transport factor 2 family protein [Brevibacterium ravenspurgense]|uniref:nuclear transport factor 2 family protein n=1 Tax=Brevibacterium ravenspurgense TaxID=479117 RepID=UPI001EF206E6|nr:nuclear transport factor 2 family protein [Brevibacterium ravenspurgense]MCG7300566.1 nuclear transport factor 2 family protein [Brevibacterium ravenspurgense]